MSNNSNSTKFSIRRKIRNSKRLIYQGFQSLKEYIFLHKIGILRELAFLSIIVLITLVFLQFIYISGLKNDYVNLNNAYIDSQTSLDTLSSDVNELLKNNNKLKEEITEQQKIIDEKDEFIKAIKKELNITKEKLTSNQQTVSRGGGVSSSNSSKGEWMTFEATAYTKGCYQCSGITAGGTDLNKLNYTPKIIAADPKVLPLGTKIEIEGMGVYTVDDTGGKIKQNRIDILHSTKDEAYKFGRRNVRLRIVN